MTIFDEQLQIFKIRETLVTRALRDYMKLDKTNVTITRGEMAIKDGKVKDIDNALVITTGNGSYGYPLQERVAS